MKNLQSDTREAPVNVDLPFEGGDGKRLGGDLVRLSGTEEGGGDAEAGDEEEKGRANHLRFARQLCLWLVARGLVVWKIAKC